MFRDYRAPVTKQQGWEGWTRERRRKSSRKVDKSDNDDKRATGPGERKDVCRLVTLGSTAAGYKYSVDEPWPAHPCMFMDRSLRLLALFRIGAARRVVSQGCKVARQRFQAFETSPRCHLHRRARTHTRTLGTQRKRPPVRGSRDHEGRERQRRAKETSKTGQTDYAWLGPRGPVDLQPPWRSSCFRAAARCPWSTDCGGGSAMGCAPGYVLLRCTSVAGGPHAAPWISKKLES